MASKSDIARKIEQAISALRDLGLPAAQQNERSALTLLSLINLGPKTPWVNAEDRLIGITPMMDFFRQHYAKDYAPNSRETVRRQTVHQFLDAGIILINPDDPNRATNSGKTVYKIEASTLELLRTYGTSAWEKNLKTWLVSIQTLKTKYAQERQMRRIPVNIAANKSITLSPGGQNVLIEQVINEFCPRYTPGGTVLYVGDTDEKFAHFDEDGFKRIGLKLESHGKMPDLVIEFAEKGWLILIEAVTSHGPINPKRRDELKNLFKDSKLPLVYVTTFLTRAAMVAYLAEISWETEVWVAESPSHLIHFNGERFLGPYAT